MVEVSHMPVCQVHSVHEKSISHLFDWLAPALHNVRAFIQMQHTGMHLIVWTQQITWVVKQLFDRIGKIPNYYKYQPSAE